MLSKMTVTNESLLLLVVHFCLSSADWMNNRWAFRYLNQRNTTDMRLVRYIQNEHNFTNNIFTKWRECTSRDVHRNFEGQLLWPEKRAPLPLTGYMKEYIQLNLSPSKLPYLAVFMSKRNASSYGLIIIYKDCKMSEMRQMSKRVPHIVVYCFFKLLLFIYLFEKK